MIKTWQEVYEFWFDPKHKEFQFAKNEEFDNKIYEEFYETWKAATEGMLYSWRDNIKGRLSELIVLDQFSRNLCREKSCAFEQDKMALVLAQEALEQSDFQELSQEEKKFIIMPFMHSESRDIHVLAVDLFTKLGDEESLDYEYKHKKIIDRFNRYPHRNEALGRETTDEEREFLKEPDSSF